MDFTKIMLFAVLAVLLFALGACRLKPSLKDPKYTLQEDVSIWRDLNGDYRFVLKPTGKWTIFAGPTPEEIDWSEPFAAVDGDYLLTPAPDVKKRSFFGLISPTGDTTVASERQIPMSEQPNFRDLGGLPTKDGRYIKWGTLYRSGKLSDLDEPDLGYFSSLGINTVIDLRNDIEVGEDPDRLPDGVRYHQFSISDKEGQAFNRLRRMVLKEGYRRGKARTLFIDVMRTFADSLADDAEPIFEILVNDKNAVPLLYHCTGGKDRTGFVTALILSSLGVEREVIMQDYLMSNFYRRSNNIRNIRRARLIGLDQETLEYALLVREDYMNAVFEVMDEKYGGTDEYLEQKFGLTDSLRMELRERFTAPYYGPKKKKKKKAKPDTVDTTAKSKKD